MSFFGSCQAESAAASFAFVCSSLKRGARQGPPHVFGVIIALLLLELVLQLYNPLPIMRSVNLFSRETKNVLNAF
jgi:hypothetical protein